MLMQESDRDAFDPRRVVADLRELAALTSDEGGAQRLAWTRTWLTARGWLAGKLEALPVDVETDEAGNLWAALPGERPDACVVIGGHLDSVPNGGWLDGCLGTLAGVEVLRHLSSGESPPVSVKVVDWADEEGARFGGRSDSFGAAAVAGTRDPAELRTLRDADGVSLEEALAECGISIDQAAAARGRLAGALAYLELHIEQGPVLERLGVPVGVVTGTLGVERHVVRFAGRAAHAGATPMDARSDAFMAGARFAVAARELGARHPDGFTTFGAVRVRPNIPTAVPGSCDLTLDMRHPDPESLQDLLDDALRLSREIAAGERVTVAWEPAWQIAPIDFDERLVGLAERVVDEVAGRVHLLPSGPLHDAAEVALAGVPSAMLFVQSLGGISHNRDEDTDPDHLELAVRALDELARETIALLL
jgi:hydantoinase/carbamoylase family amidase